MAAGSYRPDFGVNAADAAEGVNAANASDAAGTQCPVDVSRVSVVGIRCRSDYNRAAFF